MRFVGNDWFSVQLEGILDICCVVGTLGVVVV
jgi:hypothetical protein